MTSGGGVSTGTRRLPVRGRQHDRKTARERARALGGHGSSVPAAASLPWLQSPARSPPPATLLGEQARWFL
ncbi:hypothetical protein NDU88_007674 [Pleurodeles waltl]|uniref:Uncharacterized protein n=1 Tax=Pleurodeles waltl TaxID=8319 RepID=A0AAV7VRG9_PLEWA|nr:hypothetical protein NDU88_007674 [Pleurodeles waltl]